MKSYTRKTVNKCAERGRLFKASDLLPLVAERDKRDKKKVPVVFGHNGLRKLGENIENSTRNWSGAGGFHESTI